MDNQFFNDDIIILHQSIKAFQYATRFGEDIDFKNLADYMIESEYSILNHKKDSRDYIIVLKFSIKERNEMIDNNKNIVNHLNIVIEGHYQINKDLKKDEIEAAKHLGGLSLTTNFLRTVIFNFTSLTKNGGYYLPLINIKDLLKRKTIIPKKRKDKTE